MPGSRSKIALDIVVLPAPDGDDKTNIKPRLWIVRSSSTSLLHVLSLFSNLIDSRLRGQADFRQRVGCRFRAQGIRFPIEFLTEKVESAANNTPPPPTTLASLHNGRQFGQFLPGHPLSLPISQLLAPISSGKLDGTSSNSASCALIRSRICSTRAPSHACAFDRSVSREDN